jgi:serine/threonine protein kinase
MSDQAAAAAAPPALPRSNPKLEAVISSNPNAQYVMKKQLGSGSFGTTWKVEQKGTGLGFAAKIMDTNSMTPKDRGFVANEVRCLARCNHPNIIQHHLSEDFDGILVIIMEFADGGDLYKQIKVRQNGNKYFKEHEVLFILVQLCLALHHIHSKKMMHRDLKTANVLLTSSGIVKIGDFGFSRQYEDSLSKDVGTTFCGTPYYLSPELWKREPYSKKSEMWALGVVLYEIMSLKRPFRAATMKELMQNIVTATYEPLPPGVFSKELCDIVAALLQLDPAKRPSLRDLFQNKHIRENGLLKLKDSVDRHVRIPPETQAALVASIENAMNAAADDTIEVKPMKRKLEVHTTDKGWQPCELDLQLTQVTVTAGAGAPETFPVSTLTSVCPVEASLAGAPFVFAVKSRLGSKSFWFRESSAERQAEWIGALQSAIGI